jgi:predicted small integral membrane protein
VVSFVLAPFLLEESRDAHVKRFDAPGAALVTFGLSSLVYAITQAGQEGWLSGRTLSFFAFALALLAGFVAWELRQSEPLMRFGILRTRTVAGANVAGFILGTALFSMFLMLTLYMQQVLGFSAMRAGGDLLPGFLLCGPGIGFSFVPISIAALAGVQPAEAGLASGLFNTSQRIGGALGIAALSTIATSHTESAVATGTALPVALVDGFNAAFTGGVVVAALGILEALTLIRRDELEPTVETELALDLAA